MHLAFTFLAGRVHATPWGRHVNEGAVDWPPAPWRILRALIATGYAKLHWKSVPPDAVALLHALAEQPPVFWIPPEVVGGHTRHYMPDGGVAENKKDEAIYNRSTDLVIDAFVSVPRDVPSLVASWPIELPHAQQALLDQLLANMSHLGRAESWVEARRLDAVPDGLVAVRPGEAAANADCERVELHAPLPPAAFADWAATWKAEALRRGKPAKGKKPAEPDFPVPDTLVAALQLSTKDIQAFGWSEPPGARRVAYWRPFGAIAERPSRPAAIDLPEGLRPRAVLVALASDTVNSEVLPRLTEAVWQGEAVHDAVISLASDRGARPAPSVLTGVDEAQQPLGGHRHLHVLPMTLDRRQNRIDHLLLYAPGGFDAESTRAILRLRHTWAKDLPTLYTTVVGLGEPADFGARVAAVREARVWQSRTPFVPPRHLKIRGPNTLEGQVRAECASRGLPQPSRIELAVAGQDPDGGRDTWAPIGWFEPLARGLRLIRGEVSPEALAEVAGVRLSSRYRHFRRARRDAAKAPPAALALGLRLTFDQPVAGPLCLGYASHFGLGLFEPARKTERDAA